MNGYHRLMLFGLGAVLAGCAAPTRDDDRFINLQLTPGRQNQGAIAQVSLVAQGPKTGVNFFIGGVPDGVGRPLQLYSFIYPGSCAQLGAQPAYSMNDSVRASATSNGWYLNKTLAVSLSHLRAGGYAVVLRTSPADRNLDIFCGDIH